MALTDAEFNPEPVVDEQGQLHQPHSFEVGPPESWKRISGEYCKHHNLVADPSETEFKAQKCTNCPYHVLVERIVPVN